MNQDVKVTIETALTKIPDASMEGSCSTLESSVLLDDTPGRGISKTPLRRQSGDVVVKAPVGVVERDCEGGVEDKAKQQFVIPRRKDASSSGTTG